MNRVHSVAGSLAAKGVDGILVANLRNVRYLSGFSGTSGCLLITKKLRIFCTDSRYEEQAKREVSGFDILIEREERPREILEKARQAGIRTLGFESSVPYAFYRSLLRKGLRLKAVSNLVEELRKTKSGIEMKHIQQAVLRAENAFREIVPFIRPGVTERHVALRLEEALKKHGCRSLPFEIIVAAGKNSAMPHGRPSDNRIRPSDFVILDWGGESGGYYSDMTRTLLMDGKNLQKKKEIYETVLLANTAALASAGPGITARSVDKTARDIIKKAGYGDYFGHGTGHGVGLDVHELPRVSRFGRETLKPGMVFTVEPGIYIPGIGGVRIEDMVHVERHGTRTMTSLPKKFGAAHRA